MIFILLKYLLEYSTVSIHVSDFVTTGCAGFGILHKTNKFPKALRRLNQQRLSLRYSSPNDRVILSDIDKIVSMHGENLLYTEKTDKIASKRTGSYLNRLYLSILHSFIHN